MIGRRFTCELMAQAMSGMRAATAALKQKVEWQMSAREDSDREVRELSCSRTCGPRCPHSSISTTQRGWETRPTTQATSRPFSLVGLKVEQSFRSIHRARRGVSKSFDSVRLRFDDQPMMLISFSVNSSTAPSVAATCAARCGAPMWVEAVSRKRVIVQG